MKKYSCQKEMDIYVQRFRLYLQKISSLPDEVIDAIVNVSKSRKYKKGEILAKQGEFCDKMAYVCAGMFNVFSTQEDGSIFVARFLKEDDLLKGGIEISEPSTFTFQALCDTIVVEVPKKVMQDMSLQYPQLGSFILCMVEKCFLDHASHMIQIGAQKALDNYLLFRNKFQNEEGMIPQHLIAAYLGITPTQLSRIRKELSSAQQARKSIRL